MRASRSPSAASLSSHRYPVAQDAIWPALSIRYSNLQPSCPLFLPLSCVRPGATLKVLMPDQGSRSESKDDGTLELSTPCLHAGRCRPEVFSLPTPSWSAAGFLIPPISVQALNRPFTYRNHHRTARPVRELPGVPTSRLFSSSRTAWATSDRCRVMCFEKQGRISPSTGQCCRQPIVGALPHLHSLQPWLAAGGTAMQLSLRAANHLVRIKVPHPSHPSDPTLNILMG